MYLTEADESATGYHNLGPTTRQSLPQRHPDCPALSESARGGSKLALHNGRQLYSLRHLSGCRGTLVPLTKEPYRVICGEVLRNPGGGTCKVGRAVRQAAPARRTDHASGRPVPLTGQPRWERTRLSAGHPWSLPGLVHLERAKTLWFNATPHFQRTSGPTKWGSQTSSQDPELQQVVRLPLRHAPFLSRSKVRFYPIRH
ncbi:hypothetical protein B0T20DRAFT_496494 [Sordaria brevicollis]|uniref:Uncharacterized protein n=1 Tax=Sordaria brevicollis TaxID=83679 RepID=A0AAE0PHX0_SORBR|nr:hypothetical protein B0T20DRAFT_496494 [Sordaria brevicollis]